MITLDIRVVDKWDESQHPRGTGKKGGQFVRKGEAGGGQYLEEGKTPIGSFVSSELKKGTSPEQIAEKLKTITALHKNPDYINRIFRKIEAEHGLTKGILGKAGAKAAPQPKPEPAKPTPQPQPVQPSPPKEHGTASQEQIAAMIAKKPSPEEQKNHANAWEHATPEFIQAARNVKPLKTVIYDKKMNSHYNALGHYINMAGKGSPEFSIGTWRHEFGHALDFNGKFVNKSFQFHDVMVKEGTKIAKGYVKGSGDKPQLSLTQLETARHKAGLSLKDMTDFRTQSKTSFDTGDYVLSAINNGFIKTSVTKHCLTTEDAARLQDFLGAMTMNKVGWGHSTAYYKKHKHFRTAEMFANYVALTQKEGCSSTSDVCGLREHHNQEGKRMNALFYAAVELYAGKFGDTPTVVGLSESAMKIGTSVLMDAIKNDAPLSDEEFYAAIGMDPPDDDMVI